MKKTYVFSYENSDWNEDDDRGIRELEDLGAEVNPYDWDADLRRYVVVVTTNLDSSTVFKLAGEHWEYETDYPADN